VIHAFFQRGLLRLVLFAGLAVMATACDFQYRAAVDPVEDEVQVWVVPNGQTDYDHPVHLSSQEMTSILQAVRVQFKANWLQRLITGPLDSVPLFQTPIMARVAFPLAEALEKAGARQRIVFYVAQRRTSDHRDVTSGSLFVQGRNLTIMLANYQNRVDVIPGLRVYDRASPEVAVAPQQFALAFSKAEYVVDRKHNFVEGVLGMFEDAPPRLTVDYAQFLRDKSQSAAMSGR
jgi:hypothetical protein